jgi:hypothetical protein
VGLGAGPGIVKAILRLPDGRLVVGGDFDTAGTVTANGIAIWDGSAWSSLGFVGAGGVVDLDLLPNGGLLVLAVAGVMQWDGVGWTTVMPYANNFGMEELAVLDGGSFVVGGRLYSGYGQYTAAIEFWPSGHRVVDWFPRTRVTLLERMPNGDLLISGFREYEGAAAWGTVIHANPPFGGVDASLPSGYFFDLSMCDNGDLLCAGTLYDVPGGVGVARLRSACVPVVAPGGSGCTGSAGSCSLAAQSLPWIGGVFEALATGAPTTSLAAVVFGFAEAATPLSAILPQGLPGCEQLVTMDAVQFQVPFAGSLDTAMAIPGNAAFLGTNLYHQVLFAEFAAGGLVAVTSTNRLNLTFGTF